MAGTRIEGGAKNYSGFNLEVEFVGLIPSFHPPLPSPQEIHPRKSLLLFSCSSRIH
jgi:hypothetical protein